MVRELVRLHGGSVEARSGGPGRGSELLVHLPISAGGGPAPDAGAPAGESTEPPRAHGNGAGSTRGSGGPAAASRESKAEAGAAGAASPPIRVLVVDDNVDSARTLGTLLGRLGHHVRIAHDGKSALDAAREHAPHLVLLDLSMPGIDGFTVARRLRDERRTAVPPRLVALTGFGNDDARRRTREAGFDDHLVKPVDLPALQELLARPMVRG
jgi:CheY-like chemotaxis protein